MADHGDRPHRVVERRAKRLDRRSRSKPVVDPDLGGGGARDRLGGLLCSQERACDHEARGTLVSCEPLGEPAGLVAPASGQRPELVGIARLRVRVANEEHEHSPSIAPRARASREG